MERGRRTTKRKNVKEKVGLPQVTKEHKTVKEKKQPKRKRKTTKNKDQVTPKPHYPCLEKKHLSIKHKTLLVELYFLHRNYQLAADAFVGLHPEYAGLGRSTVFGIIQKFRECGSVADRVRTGRPKSANVDVMTEMFSAKIASNPNVTARQLAKEGGISKTSVLRILKEARFQQYKIGRAKAVEAKAASKKNKTVEISQKSIVKRPSGVVGELAAKDPGTSKNSNTGFHEQMNSGTSFAQGGGNCNNSVGGFHQQTGYHPYNSMPPYDGGYGNYYNVAQ